MEESPEGVLWVGGDYGLYTYDGYRTRKIAEEHIPGPVLSIAVLNEEEIHYVSKDHWGRIHHGIPEVLMSLDGLTAGNSGLVRDAKGNLYLGTENGLFLYDGNEILPVETVFERIDKLAFTPDGILWMGEAESARIAVGRLLSPQEMDLIEMLQIPVPVRNYAYQLFPDSQGNMWLVSEDRELPPAYFTPAFELTVLDDLRGLGGSNVCFGIAESLDGAIWISSRRHLYRYFDKQFKLLDSEEIGIPTSIPQLRTLGDGSLLVSGPRETTVILNLNPARISSYGGLHYHGEDLQGGQWFISEQGRVGRNPNNSQNWDWFSAEDGIPEIPSSIFISRDGTVWVSGSHEQVACISRYDGKEWKRDTFEDMADRIGHLSAYESSKGGIYFGAGSEHVPPSKWEGGIVLYTPNGPGYEVTRLRPPFVPFRVASITEGPEGDLYTSGPGFHRIVNGLDKPIPVPGLEFPGWWIDSMTSDNDGSLWLCAWGRGVYQFFEGHWQIYSESDGLLSNRTIFALPSHAGEGIWVITDEGLVRFDGQSWITVFPFEDSVERESSNLRESSNGTLWMNFSSRSWYFRTSLDEDLAGTESFYSIRYTLEKNPPMVFLKETPDSRVVDGDVFFQWEGSDFWSETPEEALQYSYRINGQPWSAFSDQTQVNLPKLKRGAYSFEVRVRDRDMNVSSTAGYHFTVVAPLWTRPWFITTVILTLVLIASLIAIIVRNRIRHVLEIEELKIQFFTYLSHELRTPLAVVLGPLDSAIKQVENPAILTKLKLARRNANRVLSLVDQLLDFRKFEFTRKNYNPQPSDLHLFLQDVIESVRPLVEEKAQRLDFRSTIPGGFYVFDGDMLHKICSNLISNGVKYSPQDSRIRVQASLDDDAEDSERKQLVILVEDEGVGISSENQKLVFEPFFRIKSSHTKARGTGLGLAVVKSLVDACGGKIELKSPVSERGGTCFTVTLPVRKADVPAKESWESREEKSRRGERPQKQSILIVDDDADFCAFVRSELEEDYEVRCAGDGAEGLKISVELIPDLIISDFHMPGMNGESMCRAIKENVETCHIPIILLTSDTSRETELVGIKSFADEFLHKPVQTDLLKARIAAILEIRKRLRDLFSQSLEIKPSDIAVNSTDETLLKKAMDIVEKEMQNEDFGLDQFSRAMAMSTRTLHRKLKGITGLSPSQFIRTMRLKRAAQLFQKGISNVSEVMVEVGILDASYFSRIFKNEFGQSPTQFIANCKKD